MNFLSGVLLGLGIDSIEEIIFLLFGLIFAGGVSMALIFINRWLKAKANITIFENEEQLRAYLTSAIFNGFYAVVKNNDFSKIKEDRGNTNKAIKEYVKQTSPEVLKRLKVDKDNGALDQVINANVSKIIKNL